MDRSRVIGVAAGAAAVGAGLAASYRWWLSRSGAASPCRVGYPPLGVPKALAEDLWVVDDTIAVSGLSLPIRMTVVRLDDGGLLLHSPVGCTPALTTALEAMGPVRHILAPGTAHWTHLQEWQQAFPQAITWAVPGLRDRLQVRRSSVRIDHDLSANAPSAWAGEIEQGLLEGGGFRECYLFHRKSGTLILCDTVQNLEPGKLPPVTRLLTWLAAGTRATTTLHVRAALRMGGADAKAAVRTMIGLAPRRVVFSHGALIEADAPRKLREAFRWLVGPA